MKSQQVKSQQVFSDIDLSRRLERAEGLACASFVDARARIAPEVGACRMELAGTFAMFDGPDSPITQTFGLGVLGDCGEEHLSELEEFFRQRAAPVFHEVSPLAGVPLAQTLVARGYRPIEMSSVMYQDLAGASSTSVHPELKVRIVDVKIPGERDVWVRTNAAGWAETPEFHGFMLDLGNVLAAKDNSLMFLVERHGQPVAGASLSLENGVALMSGASTIPAARGHGAQQALLFARLAYARQNGCDLAMMCAAPGSVSQRNAERNGFRIAYIRTKWMLAA